jgi:hypothetical protein
MLTICSDLDETADSETYFETIRYLNTDSETKHGTGVNLEIGNTIYFNMPEDQFSYWNTDDKGRKKVQKLIQSGYIDCLHSFGDYAADRKTIERNLDELKHNDCKISVWIDHAIAPTNIDSDIMKGSGDQSGTDAFHTDLTIPYGIKYVWLGRVTSVIGQDTQRRLAGIWAFNQPLKSGKTLCKEFIKGIMPKFGNSKYAMHRDNRLLKKRQTSNRSIVWEFLRCNPSYVGVSSHETGDGIGIVLNKNFLNTLIAREGKCILYTHLGKLSSKENRFSDQAKRTFELLKQYADDRQILVTTTRRHLDYTRMTDSIRVSYKTEDDTMVIDIQTEETLPLDGLTLEMQNNSDHLQLFINGKEFTQYTITTDTNSGKQIVAIPWQPLSFPDELI